MHINTKYNQIAYRPNTPGATRHRPCANNRAPFFHHRETSMLPLTFTYAWDVPRCTQLHYTNPASCDPP